MADNTTLNTMTGGDIISSDVVTTLNGGAVVTGEKAQRVKVGWGVDATFNDTNATTPLPVVDASATPAGTNLIGKVGIDQTTNGTTNGVNILSRAAGGLTTYTLISAASTNAQFVKASAGTVYSVQASNTGTAVAFLKLYNKASAPTVGTDVAVKTLIIPAGGGTNVSLGADMGANFGTGIAHAITGLATTADTTAVALSQVVINIDYA